MQHNRPDLMDTCGPGRVFTSSLTGQSGDNTSVESISESLNGTTVECDDADSDTVGSTDICVLLVGKKIYIYMYVCTYYCLESPTNIQLKYK